MSSENKKGFGSLILLFLVFILIAALSWIFFNDKNKTADKDSLADKIAKSIQSGDEINEDAVSIDDINAARPDNEGHEGHNHATANDDNEMIGVAGKVHTLSPADIYGLRAVGDANAPVKIQEFFSLTCNHCAAFHEGAYAELKQKMIDTGKVYLVYEEFPLNGPALYGSMIARCMPEDRYAKFVDILLKQQDEWAFGGNFKEGLKKRAKLMGMSDEDFDACYANKDLQKAIAANIQEASDVWKINSTPSFVINDGERILYGGQTYETFEKLYKQLTGEDVSSTTDGAESSKIKTMLMQAQEKARSTVNVIEDPLDEIKANIDEATDTTMNAIKATADKAVDATSTSIDNVTDGAVEVIDSANE